MEVITNNGYNSCKIEKENFHPDLVKNGEKKLGEDEILLLPFSYVASLPSKNIRGMLSQAFNYWLNVEHGVLRKVDNICDMLHNSSLL